MKILLKLIVFSALCVLSSGPCLAEEGKILHGIEYLAGFATGKLESQGNYRLNSLFVDLDFDLKPFLEKRNINLPGLFQFVDEPFISYVFNPNNNAEVGNNFLIKIGALPETSKFQPYFKGGVGLIYITQHVREQATQFNFSECAGIGFHYFLKENLAFTIEYRYRHISNADIDKPNRGIDNSFAICGISCLF